MAHIIFKNSVYKVLVGGSFEKPTTFNMAATVKRCKNGGTYTASEACGSPRTATGEWRRSRGIEVHNSETHRYIKCVIM